MNTIIKYIWCFCSAAFLASAFTSCTSPDEVAMGETDGKIYVMLRAISNGTFENEHRIESVRVLVFAHDVLEANQTFTSADGFVVGASGQQLPFFCVENVATGPKQVYVVANETPDMAIKLSALQPLPVITKIDALTEIYTSLSGIPFDLYDATSTIFYSESKERYEFTPKEDVFLPMAGKGTGTVNSANYSSGTHGGFSSTTITLTHLTARIDVIFNKVADYAIKIKSVSVENNMNNSFLWRDSESRVVPNQSAYDLVAKHAFFGTGVFPYIDISQPFTFPVRGETGSGAYLHLAPIYVFENLSGTPTKLKIVADFTDVLGYEHPGVEYWVNINGRDTGINEGDPVESDPNPHDSSALIPYTIRRGNIYIIEGTITGKEVTHFTTKLEIAPWILGNNAQLPLQ